MESLVWVKKSDSGRDNGYNIRFVDTVSIFVDDCLLTI
jgi:hypothetical protein